MSFITPNGTTRWPSPSPPYLHTPWDSTLQGTPAYQSWPSRVAAVEHALAFLNGLGEEQLRTLPFRGRLEPAIDLAILYDIQPHDALYAVTAWQTEAPMAYTDSALRAILRSIDDPDYRIPAIWVPALF